jgi:DNA-binding CsgD family transcriptional regulator
VLLRLATVREDDPGASIDLCRRALTESGGDDELDAEIHGMLAIVWLLGGDVGEARVAASSAVECAERVAAPESLAAALAHLGLMDTLAGERPSHEFWERAVAFERSINQSLWSSPSMTRGLHLMYADRIDEARTSLEESYRRAVAHGDDGSLGDAQMFLTELECRAGNLHRARQHAESLYQIVGQTGREQVQGASAYAKAMVDAYLGYVEEARAVANEGIAFAEAADDTIFRIQNLAVLGFLELSVGDAAAADSHLRPLWPLLASMGYGEPSVYPVLPNAIEALIGIGELEEAVSLLEQLEERGHALDSPWALSQAARCRGLLAAAHGDQEGALGEFERALAEHERMPGPFERGRTLLAQGATLRRLKRRRAARGSLEQALAIFEEMGARLWAEKARAELARIGGRAPTAGLTPTEERVAELVAEGRSNKEVARELFVGVKTIERNLSRVYEKLEIRSRSELARRFAERKSVAE